MRADRATTTSIATIMREGDKYLAKWMSRPLDKIERGHCRELHEQLSKQHGPYLANRVMRHIRAAWNTALKEHDLPANPTIAVHWNKESRRQEPISWANLPAWRDTVNSIEPIIVNGKRIGTRPGIRGDYQMFLLLTGLRRMDAATVRWERIDLDEAKLHRPNPKGGKERAFTIPAQLGVRPDPGAAQDGEQHGVRRRRQRVGVSHARDQGSRAPCAPRSASRPTAPTRSCTWSRGSSSAERTAK